MSGNNNVDEQRESDESDIAEVTQLCHEYSNEREDFHKLGFQCLLKKLKEIEKIILTISKMSGNEALQYQKDAINAFKDDVVQAANLSSHQRAPPKDIQLPEDLTFHSKQVVLEIFQQFEANMHDVTGRLKIKFLETLNEAYCVMESTVNTFSQAQKTGAKNFIEGLLNSECSDQNTSQRQRNVRFKQAPPANNDYELQLPEDLSPFTKSVLNEIFANYETSVANLAENIKKHIHELLIGAFGQFESSVDSMTENQSANLKHEMESVFGGHSKGKVTKAGSKVMLSKNECGFDTKLARHFQELSRVVQVILDKDSAAVTIDENHAVVDKNKDCVINDAPDQVIEEAPVACNANTNQDDFDETEYLGMPDLKMDKKRRARNI